MNFSTAVQGVPVAVRTPLARTQRGSVRVHAGYGQHLLCVPTVIIISQAAQAMHLPVQFTSGRLKCVTCLVAFDILSYEKATTKSDLANAGGRTVVVLGGQASALDSSVVAHSHFTGVLQLALSSGPSNS